MLPVVKKSYKYPGDSAVQSGLENPLRAKTVGAILGVPSTRVLLIENESDPASLLPAMTDVAAVVRVTSQDNAWEQLLLNSSFDAVVCNVQVMRAESLSLIAAIRNSMTPRISRLAIFTVEPFAGAELKAATDWVKLGASGHFTGSSAVESLRLALYGPKGAGTDSMAKATSPDRAATNVSHASASQVVHDWLKDRFNPDDGWLILHGALEQRVMGETGPRRPARLAILQQYLRKGDELLVEDERLFWIAVRVDDELLGARLALRIALKLMRSSDPARLPIAVAISGSCLTETPDTAVDLCRRNLPTINQAGDVSIAIDRWRFSLPIRVAQTLVVG